MKNEEEFPASFAIITQTEKVIAMVHDKHWVEMEKTLKLCLHV